MATKDRTTGMKSAYELALERMERDGIERPREDALSDAVRQEMAEARRRAESKLAELEILHRDKLKKTLDPAAREEQEDHYRRDRERIESERERQLAALRVGAP